MHARTIALRAAPAVLIPAVLAAGAFTALAQPVIDSFEMGPIHLSVDGATVTQFNYVSDPSHCIAPVRTVHFTSNVMGAGPSTLDVFAFTAADDELEIFFGNAGGECLLEYVPDAPVDLTDGLKNDRIEINFHAETIGGTVELRLWDDQGGYVADSLTTGPGPTAFPFGPWGPGAADPKRVTRVEISIRDGNGGVYDIREIRCMRRASSFLEFDASGLVAIGPPYPLPPVLFQISDNNGPVEEMAMTLADALTVGGTRIGMSMEGADGGGDVGIFGTAAQLTGTWDGAGTWQDCGFDLGVDFSAIMGVDPAPFLPALPAVMTTKTGFLLQFDVWSEDSDGVIVSTSRRWMSLDVPGPQGVMAIVPCVMPPPVARTGSAAGYPGFVLHFEVAETGTGVDPAEPLFEVMVLGDCVAGAPTDAPAVAPARDGGPALTARPSVTRSGTVLALASPARAGGRIDLFDVTGRLVRRLGVAAGASAVAWDGRSGDGGRVPAGVYFARVAEAGPGGTARVVVVR